MVFQQGTQALEGSVGQANSQVYRLGRMVVAIHPASPVKVLVTAQPIPLNFKITRRVRTLTLLVIARLPKDVCFVMFHTTFLVNLSLQYFLPLEDFQFPLTNRNEPIVSSQHIEEVALVESFQKVIQGPQCAFQQGTQAPEVNLGQRSGHRRRAGWVELSSSLQGHGFYTETVEQTVVAVWNLEA